MSRPPTREAICPSETLGAAVLRDALVAAASGLDVADEGRTMRAAHTLKALGHGAGLATLVRLADSVETAYELRAKDMAWSRPIARLAAHVEALVASVPEGRGNDRQLRGLLAGATDALARSTGKRAELSVQLPPTLSAGDSGLLASVVVHLLRNAVAHGLEDDATRAALGKPPTGRLALTVDRVRDVFYARFSDDGRGLDDQQRPRAPVTPIAGRGVGLDAARATLKAAGGDLQLEHASRRGTSFTFRWAPR